MKVLFPFLLLLTACAVVVHPTGGDKDVTPPTARRVSPDSNAIDFKENKIRILFDEYVEIKDANGVLLSPPPKTKPRLEIAGKSLIVHFKEELRDSTTYTLQLVNALHDVNEKNVLPYYELIFSTGSQIDTNSITGKITDNYTGLPTGGYTVALFHSNVSDYPDSTIYPLYISKSKDDGSFQLSAIKTGSYTLYAFNDVNSNLRFETGENFAYYPQPVNSNDTVLLRSAEYGKPAKPIAFTPVARDRHSFLLPIKTPQKGSIELLPLTPRYDKSQLLYTYPVHSDTLLVVDFVKNETDTIATYQLLYNKEIIDTVYVQFPNRSADHPIVLDNPKAIPGKPILVKSSQPIRSVKPEHIHLYMNDSVPVSFQYRSDDFHVYLSYSATDKQPYTLVFSDSALFYFDETFSKTDTLRFTTDSRNNFSSAAIRFNNTQNKNYRVELVKELEKDADFFLETNSDSVYFTNIPAAEYHIRIIAEDGISKPKQVEPFRQMPSYTYVHPSKINLRGGWTLGDIFINNTEE